MKKTFSRIKDWYNSQPPTVKCFLWLGIILIIGIIIRWDYVVEGVSSGFGFLKQNN